MRPEPSLPAGRRGALAEISRAGRLRSRNTGYGPIQMELADKRAIACATTRSRKGPDMTQCSDMMAAGGGVMMVGVSVISLLTIIALLLSIAALVKYLRTPDPG